MPRLTNPFKSKAPAQNQHLVVEDDHMDEAIHENGLKLLNESLGDDELQINYQWCSIVNYGFPEPQQQDDDIEVYQAYHQWEKTKREKLLDESTRVWKSLIDENGGTTCKLLKNDSMKKTIKNTIRKYSIPPWYRRYVWTQITGVDKKIKENRGYYKKILEVHRGQSCPNEAQIDLDLCRTFPSHPFFSNSHSVGRMQMKNVLTAFSWRNPYVSYCQSLNYLVGALLLHCGEEESFWLLVTILEDILPANYYNPELTGMRVDSYVLDELIKDRLPKLHAHLHKLGVETTAFASGWFMRVFIEVFPIETSMRVLDLVFSEGTKILFRVALSYLKLHDSHIEQRYHMGEVLHYLNHSTRRLYDSTQLFKQCFTFYNLKIKQISEYREKYTEIVDEESRELEQRRREVRKREEAKRKQIEAQCLEERSHSLQHDEDEQDSIHPSHGTNSTSVLPHDTATTATTTTPSHHEEDHDLSLNASSLTSAPVHNNEEQ
ncbi:hypothetical protein C9374_005100 [Naegleria lovaniensis]|uniref:Rab-GAP TBC domain-containing protein n=1 Tax=Naegleria lovaniensis TaxID=51637 RepID=A0AA88KKC0_NAELO|nr:uncharacterized protein C9374_005100 [Naegleria lovaniensis]KAG2382520.1 hypothetical protein C9374_005100 [Naegleria lovaniensis]